jgi:hypothetical protein
MMGLNSGARSQELEHRFSIARNPVRTYAVTIAGTTDSVRIPPAPLDKGGGDSRGDRAIG